MLPPTPLSLLCAILLCLPLAVIFTFTAPSSTSSAATSPLPKTAVANLTETNPATLLLLPARKTREESGGVRLVSPPGHAASISNQTAANITYPPPPPPPPPLPPIPAEDEDDLSLFKLASQVDPNPKPAKKLAFMFLTTSPLAFAPLWELFFPRAATKLYNIYVHADPSINYTASFQGVFANRVIPHSKPTRRHTPTLISAARRLLAYALLDDESNSMFALLSPSCIPLHSFNYTFRALAKSRRSFIEILKNEPGAHERWAARGEDAMVPEVKYEDFRIGSQFWVVKRKHARMIVRDTRLWSKFKLPCLNDDTCYPEEHYFSTLLSMVDPRGCIPCTLTHVDWKGSHAGHPRMYKAGQVGPELIWALRKARPRYGDDRSDGLNSSVRKKDHPFLFARKFSPGSLRHLMNIANEVIFND